MCSSTRRVPLATDRHTASGQLVSNGRPAPKERGSLPSMVSTARPERRRERRLAPNSLLATDCYKPGPPCVRRLRPPATSHTARLTSLDDEEARGIRRLGILPRHDPG